MGYITEQQWQAFESEGYLRLGKVVTDKLLQAMQQRIDEIMLGDADLDYDRRGMQLDSRDGADDSAGEEMFRQARLVAEPGQAFFQVMPCVIIDHHHRHFHRLHPHAPSIRQWIRLQTILQTFILPA